MLQLGNGQNGTTQQPKLSSETRTPILISLGVSQYQVYSEKVSYTTIHNKQHNNSPQCKHNSILNTSTPHQNSPLNLENDDEVEGSKELIRAFITPQAEVLDIVHYRNQPFAYAFVRSIGAADKFEKIIKYSSVNGKNITIMRRWFRQLRDPKEICVLGFKQSEIGSVRQIMSTIGPIKFSEVVNTGSGKKVLFIVYEKKADALQAINSTRSYSIKRTSSSNPTILQVMLAIDFNTTGGKKEKSEVANKGTLVSASYNELSNIKQSIVKSQEATAKEMAKLEVQSRLMQKETLNKTIGMIKSVIQTITESMNNTIVKLMAHTTKGMMMNAKMAAARQRIEGLEFRILIIQTSDERHHSMIPRLEKLLEEAQTELKEVLAEMEKWQLETEDGTTFRMPAVTFKEDESDPSDSEDDSFLNDLSFNYEPPVNPPRVAPAKKPAVLDTTSGDNAVLNIDEMSEEDIQKMSKLTWVSVNEAVNKVVERTGDGPKLRTENRKTIFEVAKEIGMFLINFHGTPAHKDAEQAADLLIDAAKHYTVLAQEVRQVVLDPTIYYEIFPNKQPSKGKSTTPNYAQ